MILGWIFPIVSGDSGGVFFDVFFPRIIGGWVSREKKYWDSAWVRPLLQCKVHGFWVRFALDILALQTLIFSLFLGYTATCRAI